MKIFDLVEKFAGYGFNKSHSAAYALVSYQTAWLKRHYPAEFMAAVMSSEIDNTDKLLSLRDECKRMGLMVKAPNVLEGKHHFSVNSEGQIIYGLGGIKGLGEGPIGDLLEARGDSAFTDLFDMCSRTDPRKVNRRALEALIKSGALDELGAERSVLMSALDDALEPLSNRPPMRPLAWVICLGKWSLPQVLEIPIEITAGPAVGRSEIFLRAKKIAW